MLPPSSTRTSFWSLRTADRWWPSSGCRCRRWRGRGSGPARRRRRGWRPTSSAPPPPGGRPTRWRRGLDQGKQDRHELRGRQDSEVTGQRLETYPLPRCPPGCPPPAGRTRGSPRPRLCLSPWLWWLPSSWWSRCPGWWPCFLGPPGRRGTWDKGLGVSRRKHTQPNPPSPTESPPLPSRTSSNNSPLLDLVFLFFF